ncbi:TPA: Abi family protein [Yersinia enterocolitica]|uniref:Abi family protein n=1 Tax=Yersinia sp. Marseille-Q3913 TaxID=2830769 RepID=UPI001BB0A738|nr:Abi family protein [Yersinia sp. Marseille-Q3913]MBS0057761.1 Abi family protein [Yersinia sp. Marseille-Q3913]HEI6857229.1 Abi family protein [Yersinia enterocolitica]
MRNYISTERLDIYEQHLKIEAHQVLAAYHWNKALAGAMLPVMQCLEVTLRNAIDMAILSHPPTGANGLWLTDHNWIFSLPRYMGKKANPKLSKRYKMARKATDPQDNHGVLLDQYGHRVIARKVREETLVDQARDTIVSEGKIITPARVIAGMNFGFWTTLLSHKYEDKASKSLLWPNLETVVFPHLPEGYSMADIRQDFHRIRALRNRLSHHEALWKFHYDDPATGLPDYGQPVYGVQASCSLLRKHYDDMLEMIGWMSPDRKANFLNHSAHLRFYALCSVDGLNSYIEPSKIKAKVTLSRGGKALNRLIKVLERHEFIRIVRGGQTVITFGADSSTHSVIMVNDQLGRL